MSYDNTDTGALFKNDKQGNEKRPDYTGTINIAGEEHRLAGWITTSKKGVTYLSLKRSEPQQPKEEKKEVSKPADDLKLDDIPF